MEKEFDKEEFMRNVCACGCNKRGREIILEKIEKYKDSEPEFAKQLIYYRDRLVKDDDKHRDYQKLKEQFNWSEAEQNKKVAETLRAYADKLEERGHHFMIYCKLPNLPIFSGKDEVEAYYSDIEISMVKTPLGG